MGIQWSFLLATVRLYNAWQVQIVADFSVPRGFVSSSGHSGRSQWQQSLQSMNVRDGKVDRTWLAAPAAAAAAWLVCGWQQQLRLLVGHQLQHSGTNVYPRPEICNGIPLSSHSITLRIRTVCHALLFVRLFLLLRWLGFSCNHHCAEH